MGILGADVGVRLDGAHSGDAAATALTAAQFEALSPEAQRQCVADMKVLARVEPHHKQSLVEALQAQHEVRPHTCTLCLYAAAPPLYLKPTYCTGALRTLQAFWGSADVFRLVRGLLWW